MKRGFIIVFIVGVLFSVMSPAFADVRYDISLNIPFVFGIDADDEDDDIQEFTEYIFVVPDLKVHKFWGDEQFRIGAGVRAFTLILESLVYPTVTAEMDIDPFRLSAGVGGGAFLFFGLYTDLVTGNVWLPEVSAAYKANEWLQYGVGATAVMSGEADDLFEQNFPYTAYAFLRFSLGD